MKSRFALLAIVCVAAAPLAAQGGGGAPGGGRGMGGINVEQMSTMYTLTPEQVAKANDLKKAYDTKTAGVTAWMTKLREGGGDMQSMRDTPGFADSMKKNTDARDSFNAEFKKILTGAQVTKFDSVQAARAARQRPAGM
ncbi:MAG: hypothetical protein ABIZ70_02195 [Gemmatimonadales bacterium]